MKRNEKKLPENFMKIKWGWSWVGFVLIFSLFFTGIGVRVSTFLDRWLHVNGVDILNRIVARVPWMIALVLFVLAVVVVLVKQKRFKESLLRSFHENRVVCYLILFMNISAILSLIFAEYKEQALYGTLYYILLGLQFVAVGIIWDGRYRGFEFFVKHWRKMLYVILGILLVFGLAQLSAFFEGGDGHPVTRIYNTYGGWTPLSYFRIWLPGGDVLRPSSLAADPNYLGIFSVLVMILAGDDILKQVFSRTKNLMKVKIFNILFALMALISGAILVLVTNSRTALLMAGVGGLTYVAAYLFMFIKERLKMKSSGKVLSVLWIDNFIQRLKDGLTLSDASSQEHVNFGQAAMEFFKKFPIFGVGVGNYVTYFMRDYDQLNIGASPHSAYLKALSEMGIVGFIITILFILYFLYLTVRSKKPVLIALMLAFIVGNFFYDFFMLPWMWFLFVIIYFEARGEVKTKTKV